MAMVRANGKHEGADCIRSTVRMAGKDGVDNMMAANPYFSVLSVEKFIGSEARLGHKYLVLLSSLLS